MLSRRLGVLRQDSRDKERVPLDAACEKVIDDEDMNEVNVPDTGHRRCGSRTACLMSECERDRE